MADNFRRTAQAAPLLLVGTASTSTQLEVGTQSGIPITGDMDANPYTTSGQTRTPILVGGDLMTENVGGHLTVLGPWIFQNLNTSAATNLNLAAVASSAQASVPRAGSIIGLVVNVTTHYTGGAPIAIVTKNGSTTGMSATRVTLGTAAGTLAFKSTLSNKDAVSLAALDRLGVQTRAATTPAATTIELVAHIWVEQ